MPRESEGSYRVAIVGASSLQGKEVKQVLEDRNFPSSDIYLLDVSVMAGTLTEAAGEPTFIRALEPDSFDGVKFAFFAGNPGDTEQNWAAAQKAGATVIDLTGILAASGQGISWIPSLDSVMLPRQRTGANGSSSTAYSSPPVAAIISCTLSLALAQFQPKRLAFTFFPPVSERGPEGVEELEKQSTSLLSFREAAQPVFDAQVAFNLLAGYGENSKPRLADIRSATAREVGQYLADRVPVPAIQLVQAPVFYGYAFAVYAEFEAPAQPAQLESALARLGVKIAGPDDTPPTNISVGGENEIHLARIDPDPNITNSVWLWGAGDNLRLSAINAVRIAEELIARPSA